MKRNIYFTFLIGTFVFLAANQAFSQTTAQLKFGCQVKQYNLSDERYQRVYGSGTVMPSLSLSFGKRLYEFRLETEFFRKTGNMTVTREEVKLSITPIIVGGRFKFFNFKLKPYIGAGIGFYVYKESLPERFEEVSGVSEGFHAELGLDYSLSNRISFNFNVRFITAKIKDTEVNLGGISIGFGAAYNFLKNKNQS